MAIVGQQNNKHSREQDKGAEHSPSPRREGLQCTKHDESPGGPLPPPARTSSPHGQAAMAMQWLLLLRAALRLWARSPAALVSLWTVVSG